MADEDDEDATVLVLTEVQADTRDDRACSVTPCDAILSDDSGEETTREVMVKQGENQGDRIKWYIMDIETVGLHMLEKELTAVNSKIQMKSGFYNPNSKHIQRTPNSN